MTLRKILFTAALAVVVADAARAEPLTLRFATTNPPGTGVNREFYHPWAERLAESSKGALAIDVRDGANIASITNVYPRVMNDVFQIGVVLFRGVSGKFNFSEVSALPFISESSEVASVALWRLYKTGMLDREYDEAIPLMLIGLPHSGLHMTRPLASLDDLAGAKIVTPSQLSSITVKKLGGTPLTLGSGETYEALQRGTAEGANLSWNAVQAFKLAEVTSWHLDASFSTASGMVFMARKTYAALPEPVKAAIDANSGEAATRAWSRWYDMDNDRGRQEAKASPKQVVVVPPASLITKWRPVMESAIAEWAASRPGVEAALARYRELVADVKAGR